MRWPDRTRERRYLRDFHLVFFAGVALALYQRDFDLRLALIVWIGGMLHFGGRSARQAEVEHWHREYLRASGLDSYCDQPNSVLDTPHP